MVREVDRGGETDEIAQEAQKAIRLSRQDASEDRDVTSNRGRERTSEGHIAISRWDCANLAVEASLAFPRVTEKSAMLPSNPSLSPSFPLPSLSISFSLLLDLAAIDGGRDTTRNHADN